MLYLVIGSSKNIVTGIFFLEHILNQEKRKKNSRTEYYEMICLLQRFFFCWSSKKFFYRSFGKTLNKHMNLFFSIIRTDIVPVKQSYEFLGEKNFNK